MNNMERPVSGLQQRPISFNPEAAAFNPVFRSPSPRSIDEHPIAAPTPPTTSMFSAQMAPMFSYSPFQGAEDMRSLYHRGPLTPAPVRLEDFLSPDVQALVKKLEEHPDIQEIPTPRTPAQKTTGATQAVAGTTTHLPPFTFPPQQAQPDHGAVNINELSAGLGLPSLKIDTNENASPAASQNSRRSQAHPGALYGKLIGWALDKPLAAKGLAEYLQKEDLHTASELPASTTSPLSTKNMHLKTESIHTPPRPAHTRVSMPAPAKTMNVPKGPSAFQHQHRRSSISSASYQHHSRNSSTRKYPRRTSRARRMDQGPMPSSADIYPDDANWTPSAPIYEGHDYIAYKDQPIEQPQTIIDNAFNWPTPAQVYHPEPAPTAADVGAADSDVLDIMRELSEPSLSVLTSLSTLQDLSVTPDAGPPGKSRALTPAQLDGSRYGMRFYGIALGDEWELPHIGDFDKSEPFRVRPRDHDGWGGWGWALRKGWGA